MTEVDEHDAATTRPAFSLGALVPGPEQVFPRVVAGRYEVGRLLGRGGTAVVHRAYDRLVCRDVAIKLFGHGVLGDDHRRRTQEAAILRGLSHPGLVALNDFGTDAARAYLVMRVVNGPVAERLRDLHYSPVEVTGLAVKLAGALASVYAEGVTHRDLKPANILLDGDDPLISDFGIARAVDSTRMTTTGQILGTAAYMAPEQVLSEPVGPAADIYALGLVLLECLSGRQEYPGTMVESAVARLHRPPIVPTNLPSGLTDLLRCMTARDPAARPTASDLTSDFLGCTFRPRYARLRDARWKSAWF